MLTFVTTQGVLIGNNVVVPRGARLLGRVESFRRGSSETGAQLQVSVRHIDWDGGSAALNAVVLGVEASDADTNSLWRHLHRAVTGRPTMLEGISVRSHVGREAFVSFESAHDDFILRRGVRLLLWQVDPERDPVMFARNPVLEVSSAAK